jgi:hypothetical protein
MLFTEELITADIPDAVPVSSLPVVPVTVSVLLHGMLGLLFFYLEPGIDDRGIPPAKSFITVSLLPNEPAYEETLLPDSPEPDLITQKSADKPDPEPADNIPVPEIPAEPQVAVLDSDTAGDPVSEEEEALVPGTFGAREINAAVSAYVSAYRQGLTGDWLADCVRYEIEHGVRECPKGKESRTEQQQRIEEIFRTMDGAYHNALISKRLAESMNRMRPFLKENSLVGQLARQRYSYESVAYEILNGEAGVPGSGPQTGPVLTPVGSKLVLLTGFMSFDLATGKLAFFDDKIINPPQEVMAFYDFSGAENQQAPEADSFRIVPSLFPSARQ